MRRMNTLISISFLFVSMFLLSACSQQKPENLVDGGTRVQQQTGFREFTVVSDDYGFYPNRIQAKIGDKVRINFKFRDDLIYYGGMDIKGPFEDVKYKLKGEQPITREFVTEKETRIVSYWPATGVKKATLIVEVEK